VLRDDFGPASDVDLLVTFEKDAPWSLLHLVQMQQELEALLGRSVDLIEGDAVRNPFRREVMLRTKEVIYAS